jgi:hypothetical protein
LEKIIEQLLMPEEPAIRYKIRRDVLHEPASSPEMQALQVEIRGSARVGRLLSERNSDGRIPCHPYKKWVGTHWVLTALADLEYPQGDTSLIPLREQEYGFFFMGSRENPVYDGYSLHLKGRVRAHASIEGNAILSLLKLGLADVLTDRLVEIVISWRWPDGGWNCDKNQHASHSSFHETLIPLRALNQYTLRNSDPRLREIVLDTAEIFLQRGMFRRLTDGEVIDPYFLNTHFPYYWHYNTLYGLKVMGEIGCLRDPRCQEALDLLEEKRLPGGGFPAERRYYTLSEIAASGKSLVSWGATGSKTMNEWITVEVLSVLSAAGRYSVQPHPGPS